LLRYATIRGSRRLFAKERRFHLRPNQRLPTGTRLFPDAGPDIALDLVDSRADSNGLTIQVYRPTGRPQYATATADHDDE
jgi:hypothetical protein